MLYAVSVTFFAEFGKKLVRLCELSLGPLDRDPVTMDMGGPQQTLLIAVGQDNRSVYNTLLGLSYVIRKDLL